MIDYEAEFQRIIPIAVAHGVDPRFMLAIRCTENGAAGREFGVLSIAAPTWLDQCRVACVSVAHRLAEFENQVTRYGKTVSYSRGEARYSDEFVKYFASRWAPAGVVNDPTDLNAHWQRNAEALYKRFCAGEFRGAE
ncbi:MAG: hypothetical protein ACREQ4_03515 [Candidatus Binataceae bacterium]